MVSATRALFVLIYIKPSAMVAPGEVTSRLIGLAAGSESLSRDGLEPLSCCDDDVVVVVVVFTCVVGRRRLVSSVAVAVDNVVCPSMSRYNFSLR